ncbi:MAG: sulfate adenylyltransferase subunit CysN [Kiritimatiellia bacterium]|jgi:bifunctional enzyme CysN/CysC
MRAPHPPSDLPPTALDALLAANRDADLLRFSTAGSVDDGKSTLIGRLLRDCKGLYDDQLAAATADSKRLNRDALDLALLTDGLKAEREQGITIDVAYRYFSTPRRRFIIADTPGHVQYTRNMATGASTANLAIILVDARHGVCTQSKRHGFIASLLGIPHVVVAVNKMDLVGWSQQVFESIRADYAAFSAKLSVPDVVYVPISALCGDNVVERSGNMPWYQGPPLLHILENVEIGGDRNLIDFRFPVQFVNRPNQDFRGFCGTVASGIVRPGNDIAVLPSNRRSRVKSIETFDGPLPFAAAGQSVTLCLEDEIDVSRGDLICHPNNVPHVSCNLEAMLVWMADAPLRIGVPYVVKHTTRLTRAVVSRVFYRVDPDTLSRHEQPAEVGLNDIARISLETFTPLLWDTYEHNRATGSLILIDPVTNATVGAAMVIQRLVAPGAAKPLAPRPASTNIRRERSLVPAERRAAVSRVRPATLWFTGLSGSGKSTIAQALEKRLLDEGRMAVVLDGDNLRHGLNRDLGFSDADRHENLRRAAEVAALFNDAGILVITAFLSPAAADRAAARDIIGADRFMEVFVDTPLAVCEARDPKGLYRKARRGEIPGFTGIDAPYEVPEAPDLVLDTTTLSVEESVAVLLPFALPEST